MKKQSKPHIVSKLGNVKDLKKRLISESKHSINVLGNKIYVSNTGTILRIGHETKMIQCNELFLLLENKAKEFMVLVTKNLISNSTTGNDRFYQADKIAINEMRKKYPKDKLYWVFVFKVLLSNAVNELNINRLKKIVSLLKLNKNKTAKNYIKEYKDKYKLIYEVQNMGDDCLTDADLMDYATPIKNKIKVKPVPYKTGGIKIQNKWKNKIR